MAFHSGEDISPSDAARAMGRVSTARKRASSAANLVKARAVGSPPIKDPLTLACTCGAGTATEIGENHKTTCPRGRLLWQRAKIAAKRAKENAEHGSD